MVSILLPFYAAGWAVASAFGNHAIAGCQGKGLVATTFGNNAVAVAGYQESGRKP
jgi:hypothetical protein